MQPNKVLHLIPHLLCFLGRHLTGNTPYALLQDPGLHPVLQPWLNLTVMPDMQSVTNAFKQ